MKKLATILMLISLGTGCTVGPNYKRPSVDVPGGYPWRRAVGGRRAVRHANLVRRNRSSNRGNLAFKRRSRRLTR